METSRRSTRSSVIRSTLAIIALAVTWLLWGTASAHAAVDDVAVSQSASSQVVKRGETVTITVTVDNRGTVASSGVGVGMAGLGGGDKVTNNPYQSFSATQGTCTDEPAGGVAQLFCKVGSLALGASARITVVVKMEETMNHFAALETEFGGEYEDANIPNDVSFMKVAASAPPVVTGSKKIKLPGLPEGCVSGDFPLKVIAAAHGVKKISASLFLGFGKEGGGGEWQHIGHGSRMETTVPASRVEPGPILDAVHKLKIKVRLKGGTRLKRTVEFQLC
jgi:Domain of unknown function DUF11